jgi:hypothetical protein
MRVHPIWHCVVVVLCAPDYGLCQELPRVGPQIVNGFIERGEIAWYSLEDVEGSGIRRSLKSTVPIDHPGPINVTAYPHSRTDGDRLASWPRTVDVGYGHTWWCVADLAANLPAGITRFPVFSVYRAPLRDYQPFDGHGKSLKFREHWNEEALDPEFGNANKSTARPSGTEYGLVAWNLPVGDAFASLCETHKLADVYNKVGYDVVPVGRNKLNVFVLAPRSVTYPYKSAPPFEKTLYLLEYEFRAFRQSLRNDLVKERFEWRYHWSRTRAIECDRIEQFQVVMVGTNAMLITDSGPLYVVPSKNDMRSNSLRRIGLRDGAIVQALIRDSDNENRTFAFTDRYWFEVREPIEYHDFDLGTLESNDPMPTLVRCAREIRRVKSAVESKPSTPSR